MNHPSTPARFYRLRPDSGSLVVAALVGLVTVFVAAYLFWQADERQLLRAGWCWVDQWALAKAYGLGLALAVITLLVRWSTGGYRLDARGLHRVRLLDRPRHWRWSELESVGSGAGELLILTERGPLRIGAEVPRWAALGEDLSAALGASPAAEDERPVTAAEMESWLALPPGGARRFQQADLWPWLIAAGIIATFSDNLPGRFVGVFTSTGDWPEGRNLHYAWPDWALMLLTAVPLGVLASWTWGRANGQGLVVWRWLRRRSIAWSAVRGCTAHGSTLQLATRLGPVRCPARGRAGRVLRRAVDELLTGRATGRVASEQELSDAALSRAAVEEPPDRGLSRGE